MKLSAIFANASHDCQKANPQLLGDMGNDLALGRSPTTKSKLQGNVERKLGKSYETHNRSQLSNSKPKPDKAPALGAAVSGKAKGFRRVTVRFVGYRTRPLDPDNFAGGCKDLLDGLRHAALISGDEAWKINLETSQEQVSHRWQEKTVIELEFP